MCKIDTDCKDNDDEIRQSEKFLIVVVGGNLAAFEDGLKWKDAGSGLDLFKGLHVLAGDGLCESVSTFPCF